MSYISYIEFNNVYKKYSNEKEEVLKNFSLSIEKGEFIVIVGPSGSGKSTLLELICGFEEVTKGEIKLDGRIINDVLPKDRDVSMVFQNYALYPHFSVYENIAFGMKIRKNSKGEIDKKVKWAAEVLGLNEYLNKKPKELSGGQRQRVALARAIVRNPKLFLMDEPLSNLDSKLRYSTANEIVNLHRSLNATTIYVTHDQREALTMADRIVVLNDGVIQQVGTPIEVYSNPNNVFVAKFIGNPQINLFEVIVKGNKLKLDCGVELEIPKGYDSLKNDEKYLLGIRPENIRNTSYSDIECRIEKIEYLGGEEILHCSIKGMDFVYKTYEAMNKKVGDILKLEFNLSKINIFEYKTKEIIRRSSNEEVN